MATVAMKNIRKARAVALVDNRDVRQLAFFAVALALEFTTMIVG